MESGVMMIGMRYIFVAPEKLSADGAVLEGKDARHLRTVLRMKPGDRIGIFDGTGRQYRARIRRTGAGKVELILEERLPDAPPATTGITAALGLLKDRKMDRLVRQLSELGVERLLPFVAERSVAVPPPERAAERVERWRRIAREALKQCRRAHLMQIEPAQPFADLPAAAGEYAVKIACWEGETRPLADLRADPDAPDSPPESVLILLGPEGGLAPGEVEALKAAGFITVSLGPRILRAETAAVAACTLVQFLYGDMGKSP